MANPATYPPTDFLNRKMLKGIGFQGNQLLEFLCTDSVYSFRDDFDSGLDLAKWSVAHAEVGTPGSGIADFHELDEVNGWIEGDPGSGDNNDIRLFSRLPLLSPSRRCWVQTSFRISNLSDVKFEFGLVGPSTNLGDPGTAGAVNVKATPSANR